MITIAHRWPFLSQYLTSKAQLTIIDLGNTPQSLSMLRENAIITYGSWIKPLECDIFKHWTGSLASNYCQLAIVHSRTSCIALAFEGSLIRIPFTTSHRNRSYSSHILAHEPSVMLRSFTCLFHFSFSSHWANSLPLSFHIYFSKTSLPIQHVLRKDRLRSTASHSYLGRASSNFKRLNRAHYPFVRKDRILSTSSRFISISKLSNSLSKSALTIEQDDGRE